MNLIIGYGEIGKAVDALVGAGYVQDPAQGRLAYTSVEYDVMHVCVPYSDDFIETVAGYSNTFTPKHVIIWSTVPIGTTTQIPLAVHSPVEGKHPALAESIEMMERWIGYNDKIEGQWFKNYFRDLGLKVKLVENSDFTEALKLLSTTEYGINIEFARYKKHVADELGMDYELTKEWNVEYNKLYKTLGLEKKYQKFVLDAPEGSLGGHCVVENSVLLDELYPNILVKAVYRHGKTPSDDKPYLNRTWLYAEYWGKGRSSEDIGKEYGCTGANILRIMKDRGIKRRTQKWTQGEIDSLIELSDTLTFKEIAEEVGKTYDAVRLKAIHLGLKSMYDPSIQSEDTRKKISATLQGLTVEEWTEFTSTADMVIRRSDEYKEWRRAVFKRDKNTCQHCGDKSTPGRNIELHADHIKAFATHPELRFDVNNGRVLCVPCHHKTDTWGGKTRRKK